MICSASRFATRSIQANKDISKGEVLREGYNFEVLRPGNRIRGLDAHFLNKVRGKRAVKTSAPEMELQDTANSSTEFINQFNYSILIVF
jgi:sialic acid synthase SpsE